MTITAIDNLIGTKEINFWDGSSDRSFIRRTSAGGALTNYRIGNTVDVLQAYGGGTDFSVAAINKALSAVGATNIIGFELAPGTWTITDNLTIPKNIVLIPHPGAILKISNTKSLTINGSFHCGLWQCFDDDNTDSDGVVFGAGSVQEVYLEWWGGSSDGTTDNSDAFQFAFNAFPRVKLATGSYVIDNSIIYLISTSQDMTYELRGCGKGTLLKLNNYTAGYAFQVNKNSAGAATLMIPRHPRIIVDNLAIDGSGSTLPSFMVCRYASVQFKNLRFTGMKYGLVIDGYCDNIRMESVYWSGSLTDGYLFRSTGNGDGHYFNQIFAGQTDKVLYLYKTSTTLIEACIGGYYFFDACTATTVDNCHFESETAYSLDITNSHITVRRCYFENSLVTTAVIRVNDSGVLDRTDLVLEDNNFAFNLRTVSSLRLPDLFLNDVNAWTKITFKNNKCFSWQQNATASAWQFDTVSGILVTATDATVNTLLSDNKHLLSGYCQLSSKNSVHVIKPLNGHLTYAAIATPAIAYCGTQTYYGNLAAVEYFYTVAVYNGSAWTETATEDSATPDASHPSIVLTIGNYGENTTTRIWRGTTTGTYTAYVDIPSPLARFNIVDHGDHADGITWLTAAVPAVKTENNTMDGYMTEAGKRVFYNATTPQSFTEFTGIVGDICYDTNATATSTPGWYCTTAGTPGTWTDLLAMHV